MSSRIISIETFLARYPITGRFKFLPAKAGVLPTRDTVLLKITDDAGNVGWGQSVPSPTWSYETIETVQTTIERYLAPALIGLDPFDADTIWRKMNRAIAPSFSTGQPICKAGIDLALFDLTGRARGQTASARWNRSGLEHVTLSWTVDASDEAELETTVAEARQRGYRHFNVKVGANATWDVQLCAKLRRLAPDAFVWVDANGGYDVATALDVAPKFANAGIAAFEQPLPANRLPGYRELRRQRALPILMDEGVVSLSDLETFHQLELLDGVAMKVPRCGGLTEARRILEYMEQHGLLFFASGLTDPDLALAATLLLYGSYGLNHPAALNGPQFLGGTFLLAPLAIRNDLADVPSGPGLGVEVSESRLRSGALPD